MQALRDSTLERQKLFMSQQNWVERRHARDHILAEQTSDVWNGVLTAIENCCESFNKRYSDIGRTERKTQNGCSLVITIFYRDQENPTSTSNRSQVRVTKEGRTISATTDGGVAKAFQIESDENHAFLSNGTEISADELSRLVLQDVLFKPLSI
jgi:hypothetical protein